MRKKLISSIFIVMLVALTMSFTACQAKNYTISVAEVENGTISVNTMSAAEGDSVGVTLKPNDGYKYKADTLTINGDKLTGSVFTMPASNVTVSAEFEKVSYTIKLPRTANGTITADKATAMSGDLVTLTVTPNEKYRLKEDTVKFNGKLATQVDETTFTFVMPGTTANITGDFEILPEYMNIVTVAEVLNGRLTVNKTLAAPGEIITVTSIADSGYILKKNSLKYGEELIVGMTFTMPDNDVFVSAIYEKLYTITVSSAIADGDVKVDKTKSVAGETITITVKSSDTFQLKSGTLKYNHTEIVGGSFVMPTANVDITAEFEPLTTFKRIDASGNDDPKGKYIIFGYYPQTIKSTNVEVDAEAGEDGYYLGKDKEKYAKVEAKPFHSSYRFSTNGSITSGNIYYFKLAPIKWKIIEEVDGNATIMCDTVIENLTFLKKENMSDNLYFNIKAGVPENIYANNWIYSDIRDWLNGEFFNKAFTELQRDYIANSTLDNSTTARRIDDKNIYADGMINSVDKVFLASFADITNVKYGFESGLLDDTARQKGTSDYTRAKGVQLYRDDADNKITDNGFWLTRSASSEGARSVTAVYAYGVINTLHSDATHSGIVPCLTLKLTK